MKGQLETAVTAQRANDLISFLLYRSVACWRFPHLTCAKLGQNYVIYLINLINEFRSYKIISEMKFEDCGILYYQMQTFQVLADWSISRDRLKSWLLLFDRTLNIWLSCRIVTLSSVLPAFRTHLKTCTSLPSMLSDGCAVTSVMDTPPVPRSSSRSSTSLSTSFSLHISRESWALSTTWRFGLVVTRWLRST